MAPIANKHPEKFTLGLPATTLTRLENGGFDLSHDYHLDPPSLCLDDVCAFGNENRDYIDARSRAYPVNKALPSAVKEVIYLRSHMSSNIVELQLKA
ncbi:hypothetical protein EG327_007464 [Venturia inaequalis]|uniref:Uncharacterized protein n=1 Tax=Venturia inaequalis TaxID=5025 RepID=A0A8H3UXM9_VENIN|nr:hypothetical protein EG327_007464 [Venturia inaequalis]